MKKAPVQPDLSEEEFKTLLNLSKRILWTNHETRRRVQNSGIHITPQRFYSEIPSMDEVYASFEANEKFPYLFDFMKQADPVGAIQQLMPFAAEFDPPLDKPEQDEYYWKNSAFSYSDSMSYYCMVRKHQPKNIIEIGSGFSSLVAQQAVQKNGSGDIHVVEPFPMEFLTKPPFILNETFVQKLSPEYFNDILTDGDILFIDSTHTVKMGSDCAHLYLRILPKIKRNIFVHVHDIRLPLGLHADHAALRHITWTEQHLLAAYLLDNPKAEALFGSLWLLHMFPKTAKEFMCGKFQPGGASFWFKLNGRRIAPKLKFLGQNALRKLIRKTGLRR